MPDERSLIKHTCSWRDKLVALWTLNRQAKMLLRIAFFIIFKELSVAQNCLKHESPSLRRYHAWIFTWSGNFWVFFYWSRNKFIPRSRSQESRGQKLYNTNKQNDWRRPFFTGRNSRFLFKLINKDILYEEMDGNSRKLPRKLGEKIFLN